MKFIRFGLCALLAFGVVAHGGVEDWARAVFETGAGVLFLAWALHAFFHREETVVFPRILPPLLIFFVLVFVQWAFRLTASSYATRFEMLLLAADIVFLFVFAQAFRELENWRSFTWFLLIFAFLV